MADPRTGWAADERALRSTEVPGYHPPQQHRSVETTRRMLGAGWDAMAAHPTEPLRLEEVLEGAATSASSFYARFDGVEVLVEVAGLLALDADRGRPASGDPMTPAAATAALFAPVLDPRHLPREVLAIGLWSDPFLTAHHRQRTTALQALAARVTDGLDGLDDLDDRAPSAYGRTLTWVHLVAALSDQAWSVGRLAADGAVLVHLADHAGVLAEVVLRPSPAAVDRALRVADLPRPSLARRAIIGRSDRGAQALGELRSAVHRALVEQPRELVPGDVARSVHRSRSAFFDAFGTTGAALADLARAEQVARIPTELFRPRLGLDDAELVAHLVRRVRAWQDHQGITGRRLLQAAARHPELAAEVVGQVLDSVELLTGWYQDRFDLPLPLVRLVFLLILTAEQHQVVWGPRPAPVTGPDAVAALLAPVLAGVGTSGGSPGPA